MQERDQDLIKQQYAEVKQVEMKAQTAFEALFTTARTEGQKRRGRRIFRGLSK